MKPSPKRSLYLKLWLVIILVFGIYGCGLLKLYKDFPGIKEEDVKQCRDQKTGQYVKCP